MSRNRCIKLVVTGDDGVGKTCLFAVLSTGRFPRDYVPTVLGGCVIPHEVDGQTSDLALWDTAGHEDYDRIRPLSYFDADAILLCFSLVDSGSFDNVENKWYPELTKHCPDVPIVLVGTKLDLREDKEEMIAHSQSVSMEQGIKMQTKNAKVVKYLECSALTNYGVKEVFDEATRAAASNSRFQPQRNTICLIS